MPTQAASLVSHQITLTMSTMSKKKVVIVCSGSRGDVQPYVLLGLEIHSRGHEVAIATESRMQALVQDLGRGLLTYKHISGDPTGMLFEKKYQALLAKGSIMPVMRATEEHNRPFLTQVLTDTAAACKGADLILAGPLSLTATMCVAEKLRVPWVPVVLGPVMPTAAFPSWAISTTPFKSVFTRWLNRASYSFIFWALWKQEAARVNAWRESALGLPPMRAGPAGVLAAASSQHNSVPQEGNRRVPIPVVTMCSSHIIPGLQRPADWGDNVHLTGFAFPPRTPPSAAAAVGGAVIDPALLAFMTTSSSGGSSGGVESPSKPIYLGFGSMPAPDPRALLQLAVDVVQQTGRRAVLVAGWSELQSLRLMGGGEGGGAGGGATAGGADGGCSSSSSSRVKIPPGLLVVPHAPHDWLLPRCCIAVHHAGVGTCGAVLRAGIPSVVCPVMLDQPFLAARLVEVGVACTPLPFSKLNSQDLVSSIQRVLADNNMQARAVPVAQEVAAYGGVAQAADIALSAANPWGCL